MPLFAIGINHHTTPITLRERVAFSLGQIKPALHALKTIWPSHASHVKAQASKGRRPQAALSEAAILSTCNRTELYCVVDNDSMHQPIIAWLSQYHGISMNELAPHLYTLPQFDGVRHAFRVASGLDSMVLGETQILGQLKDAVRTAAEAGALGTYLNQLFQRAFTVAKAVRSQTAIGTHSISIAAATVRLAQRIFETISDQRVLFIGAGKMIELCATHFAAQHPRTLVIANRTIERGLKLAKRLNGQVIALSDLPMRLHEFDIVVSCTASPLPIIGLGTVQQAIRARRHRPIFMVDFAVPRDIEPEVQQMQDVFLYTIDDLALIIQEGQEQRQAAVNQAEAIIEMHVQHFIQWFKSRSIVSAIRDLYHHADLLRGAELIRAQKRLARGDDPSIVLEAFSQALMNKFIHGPIHALTHAHSGEREQLAQFLPELFKQTATNLHR